MGRSLVLHWIITNENFTALSLRNQLHCRGREREIRDWLTNNMVDVRI